MPVSPARRIAFDILLRVEEREAYSSELLAGPRINDPALSHEDRALAYEIVMGVLRWRSLLDHEIAHFSFTPMQKLDAEVLTALRIGVYQLRYLTRIPKHAAVTESVELVKCAKKSSAAGLANAVLRKVSSAKAAPATHSLAAQYAHPEWILTRWRERFGDTAAAAICQWDQQPPPTHIRIAAGHAPHCVLRELAADAVHCQPAELLRNCWRVTEGALIGSTAFRQRKVVIQDQGSQLVGWLAAAAARVLAPRRILDCCAAPGGKTMQLAETFLDAHTVAAELHPRRASMLRRLCSHPQLQVIAADAGALPFYPGTFDLVLADVPCSGTGTLARNPEIKWKLTAADITDLAARQQKIARGALAQVRPGGVLVYSTCSLERDEDEHIIETVLSNGGATIIPAAEVLALIPELDRDRIADIISGNFLRLVPGKSAHCDGFFAAILRKH